ncbi:MAG: alpha/beta fold hydrolase [Candidatus Riflebacteria bacterium]
MLTVTKIHQCSDQFVLENGQVLKSPEVAYVEFGQAENPVIYIAHGGMSSHLAAGQLDDKPASVGWWNGLIGDGKAFDTRYFRVICANSLGSNFGTASPRSINLDNGRRYGKDFPEISIRDMTNFIRFFLEDMGVRHISCMAGPSMGSLQTLQMAAIHPDFVDSIVAVATAGRTTPMALAAHHFMISQITGDSEFRQTENYFKKPIKAFDSICQFSRIFYAHEKSLMKTCWDTVADGVYAQSQRSERVEAALNDRCFAKLKDWDPDCLLTVLRAINTHDLTDETGSYGSGAQRISCPTLLMNFDTDQEFSPQWAVELSQTINGGNRKLARARTLTSDWGHLGCITEVAQLEREIREFLTVSGIDGKAINQ